MQRYRSLAPYLLPPVCVAALLCVAAQKKESGNDPYTPTKLEWLVLQANLGNAANTLNYTVNAVQRQPDTVVLVTRFYPNYDAQKSEGYRKMALSGKRYHLEKLAKARGWDQWLKIESVEKSGLEWPLVDD